MAFTLFLPGSWHSPLHCQNFGESIRYLSSCAGNARFRNFQLEARMEERIDILEEQLENGSATCISDDECSGLPQCADNGYGNECYCQLPMGVCDGDFLAESETGHCVKPHLGCNRSMGIIMATHSVLKLLQSTSCVIFVQTLIVAFLSLSMPINLHHPTWSNRKSHCIC